MKHITKWKVHASQVLFTSSKYQKTHLFAALTRSFIPLNFQIKPIRTFLWSNLYVLFQAGRACFRSPCLNGATCTNYCHQYVCVCTGLYEGKTCEIPKGKPSSNTTIVMKMLNLAIQRRIKKPKRKLQNYKSELLQRHF